MSLTVWPADKVTDGFCIETVNPWEGTEAVSVTVPLNPPRLVTAIWDWVFWPGRTVRTYGLAASLKSNVDTVTPFETTAV